MNIELIDEWYKLKKQYCDKGNHMFMIPPMGDVKSRLRTDGVYVQLGFKPITIGYSESPKYNRWYTMMRIFDDKHIILFGDVFGRETVFYDSLGKDTDYSSFNLTNPSNPVITAQEIAKIPMSEFYDFNNYYDTDEGLYMWKETTPYDERIINYMYLRAGILGDGCACSIYESLLSDKEYKKLGWAQYTCNNDFYLYYEDNPLVIKQTYCDHPPFYFIPTDLSLKEVWTEKVDEWLLAD